MAAYSREELERMWIAAGGPPHLASNAAEVAMSRTGGNPQYSSTVGGTTYKGAWGLPDYLAATNDPIQQARLAAGYTSSGSNMGTLSGDPGLPWDWLTNLIGIDKIGRTLMYGSMAFFGFVVMCFGIYLVFLRDYVRNTTKTILGTIVPFADRPSSQVVQGPPKTPGEPAPVSAVPTSPAPPPKAANRPLAPTKEYPAVPARDVKPEWYTGTTMHVPPISKGGSPRPGRRAVTVTGATDTGGGKHRASGPFPRGQRRQPLSQPAEKGTAFK